MNLNDEFNKLWHDSIEEIRKKHKYFILDPTPIQEFQEKLKKFSKRYTSELTPDFQQFFVNALYALQNAYDRYHSISSGRRKPYNFVLFDENDNLTWIFLQKKYKEDKITYFQKLLLLSLKDKLNFIITRLNLNLSSYISHTNFSNDVKDINNIKRAIDNHLRLISRSTEFTKYPKISSNLKKILGTIELKYEDVLNTEFSRPFYVNNSYKELLKYFIENNIFVKPKENGQNQLTINIWLDKHKGWQNGQEIASLSSKETKIMDDRSKLNRIATKCFGFNFEQLNEPEYYNYFQHLRLGYASVGRGEEDVSEYALFWLQVCKFWYFVWNHLLGRYNEKKRKILLNTVVFFGTEEPIETISITVQ